MFSHPSRSRFFSFLANTEQPEIPAPLINLAMCEHVTGNWAISLVMQVQKWSMVSPHFLGKGSRRPTRLTLEHPNWLAVDNSSPGINDNSHDFKLAIAGVLVYVRMREEQVSAQSGLASPS